MRLKRCTKCQQEKGIKGFSKNRASKDGYNGQCKACKKEYHQEWYKVNRERVKERNELNKEKIKVRMKEWRIANKDKIRESKKRWYENNPEKRREMKQKWRKSHPEKQKEHSHCSDRKRRSTLKGKLNSNISLGIWRTLRRGSKANRHWEELVVWDINDLKRHLEKQFIEGMTWDNYGEWHIDHIIPVSVFNFETPEDIDFKRCWALKNLQPLWAFENMSKGNKISKPFQPALNLEI